MGKIPVHPSHAKNTASPSLSDEERAWMRALGFRNPAAPPDEHSALPDLLLYALVPSPGTRPDQGIVLGVAAELESLVMFIEGPLSTNLELLARRLRVAMAISRRLDDPPPPEAA